MQATLVLLVVMVAVGGVNSFVMADAAVKVTALLGGEEGRSVPGPPGGTRGHWRGAAVRQRQLLAEEQTCVHEGAAHNHLQ